MQFLEFVFQDFYHWFGMILIFGVVASAIRR